MSIENNSSVELPLSNSEGNALDTTKPVNNSDVENMNLNPQQEANKNTEEAQSGSTTNVEYEPTSSEQNQRNETKDLTVEEENSNPANAKKENETINVEKSGEEVKLPTDNENNAKKDSKSDKSKEPKKKSLSFRQLLKYSDKVDRILQVIGIIFSLAAGAGTPCSMLIFGDMMGESSYQGETNTGVIDPAEVEQIIEKAKDDIIRNSLYMFAIACGMGVASFIYMWAWKLSAERQIARIRYLYFRGIIRQDVTWFDSHDPKTLSTRIVDDTIIMNAGMGKDIGMTLQSISQFIAGYIIGFTKDWSMTLVILALGIPLSLIGSYFGLVLQKWILLEQDNFAESGGVAEEAIGSIRTVASFGIENYFIQRFKVTVEKARTAGIYICKLAGFVIGTFMMVMYLTYSLGLWYGGKLVGDDQDDVRDYIMEQCKDHHDIELFKEIKNKAMMDFCDPQKVGDIEFSFVNATCGSNGFKPCQYASECMMGEHGCFTGADVITVFMSVLMGTMGLTMLGPSVVSIGQACGSGAAVYETIDRIPPIDGMDDKGKKVEHVEGKIEFRNIKFRYPSRPDQIILNGMNLIIEAGKTVGLVGASGCGKSTTIQMLQRFYDPEEGEVFVDGMNIRDLNLASFRAQMGFVGQEPVLFNGTVKDNIRNGRLDCTDEDIIKAAKDSNAHNFIMEFPKGYDTYVGEGGHSLSGGQKQRIAIARALVRNPGILLLDEATSALDSESEKIVQAALDELVKQRARTTLIIAHRLSTIETADEIVVFSGGKIAEHGTHSELIALNGIYADLRKRQMLKKKKDDEEGKEEEDDDEKENEVYIARNSSVRSSRLTSHIIDPKTGAEVEKPEVPPSRLWALAKPETLWMVIGTLCGGISGAVMPVFGILFSEMLNVYYERRTVDMRNGSIMWACVFIVFAVVLFILSYYRSLTFGATGESLSCRIRQMCFTAMLKQDIGFFDDENNNTGAMTSKLSQDAQNVKNALGEKIASRVQTVFTCIVAVIISFASYWLLTLIVLVVFPFLVIGTYLQEKAMATLIKEMRKPMEEAGALASEAVNGIRTLQSFGLQEKFSTMFGKKQLKPYEMGKKDAWCTALLKCYDAIIGTGAAALVMRVGGIWAIEGKCNSSDLMKVLMSVMIAAQSVGETAGWSTDDIKVKEATQSIFGILDRVPPIDYTRPDGETPEILGEVEFRDVKFRYPTRLDVPILRKLNLKIQRGQKIALVGSSGCGKSTIIGLLQRFYNADAGEVLLDGHEITSINIKYLRKQFGLVGQEPVLFSGTIEDNIKMGDYGNDKITHEDVVAAAKAANAHNFIMQFPDGYNTEVGNKGGSLSGGQKQRIAIARAILRNPKILLLDEATSALDTESEAVVQEAIDKLLESSDRTSIIVAHRLSTIQNADMIFVMDHGRVVEAGKHEQLMEIEGGLYRQLATKQMLLPA